MLQLKKLRCHEFNLLIVTSFPVFMPRHSRGFTCVKNEDPAKNSFKQQWPTTWNMTTQITRACSRPDSTTKRSTRDGFWGKLGTDRLLSLDTILPGFCRASSASVCSQPFTANLTLLSTCRRNKAVQVMHNDTSYIITTTNNDIM